MIGQRSSQCFFVDYYVDAFQKSALEISSFNEFFRKIGPTGCRGAAELLRWHGAMLLPGAANAWLYDAAAAGQTVGGGTLA